MGYSVIEKGGLASALKGKRRIYATSILTALIIELQPRDKSRKVYRCRVMGSRGCGKTSFCRSLIVKDKNALLDKDENDTICIKSLPLGNTSVYLIVSYKRICIHAHECTASTYIYIYYDMIYMYL